MPQPKLIALALAADGRTAEIAIRGTVGWTWSATSQEVAWVLDQHPDVETIVVRINSMGGIAHEGIGIHNMLKAHPAKVQVIVEGVAGSAASVIAMAADPGELVMYANALMMIHAVRMVEEDDWGNEIDTPEARAATAAFLASLIETYKARTGKTDDELAALLATDTWMTARQAVADGFADRVEELTSAEDPQAVASGALLALAAAAAIPADVIARAQAEAAVATEPATSEGGDPPAEPAASGTAETDPEPEPVADTFATAVNHIAVAHGLADHVGAWLLDGAITTLDQARAAIAEAREVRDLCNFAGAADQAARFIRARTPMADVRAALINARADAADALHTDGHPPSNSQPPRTATPVAVKTADIWASRRAMH